MYILTLLTLLVALALPAEADTKRKIIMPDWAFCSAYVLRDADQREERPSPPYANDPFGGDEKTWIPPELLRQNHVIDVASLVSRTSAQRTLDKKTASRFIDAISENGKKNVVMDCYNPHHIFVFYDHFGKPVAAVEVCLTCGRVKMLPSQDAKHNNLYGTDLDSIVEILDDLELNLHPFKSLKSYKQQTKELQEKRK